jgi:hypothetical protein
MANRSQRRQAAKAAKGAARQGAARSGSERNGAGGPGAGGPGAAGPGSAGPRAGGPGAAGPGSTRQQQTASRPPTVDGPPDSREQQLVEKLRRIEALHARPGSEGERQAAARARERIQARLKQLEAEEPPVEFRFRLSDQWSRHLFVALLRRYGVQPYRYRGQRRTTVMARLSRVFVNETLWPEFQELQSSLAAYFDALTDRVIEQALEVVAGEAEERGEEPA